MKNKTNRKALKQKDVERLEVLQRAHPGDLTEADQKEIIKLQDIRAKYGQK